MYAQLWIKNIKQVYFQNKETTAKSAKLLP